MRAVLGLLTALLVLALPNSLSAEGTGEADPAAYQAYLESLYRGTVPLLKPEDAAARLDADPSVIVIDVRSEAERSVSFIPGSRFVDFASWRPAELAALPRDTPVVLYCAVGYRSERAGEDLLDAGFTEVFNLYGGIIEWYNRGLPLEAAQDVPAARPPVHGYRPRWGKYVRDGNVTYEPRAE
jgi:rhodanese-related sulfurtransferase